MDNNKYDTMLNQYLEEATQLITTYDNTKESIIVKYEVMKKVFNEVEERFKRIHEGFIAGKVAQSAYDKVKKDHKLANESVKELGKKVEELDQYMYAKFNGAFGELNNIKQNYIEEVNTEINKLKLQLMNAKYEFMNAKYEFMNAKYEFLINLTQIRNAYQKLSSEEYQLQELSRELGLQWSIDVPDAFQVLSSVVMEEGGVAITSQEIYEALYSGQISAELEKEINEAKEQGFL